MPPTCTLTRDAEEVVRAFAAAPDATRLDLADCALAQLPDAIDRLADDVKSRIEILNLAGNHLEDLPAWLAHLPRLRIVFCLANDFERVPEVMARLRAVTMLSFKNCRIEGVLHAKTLPPRVDWLILTGNRIEALSDDFAQTCGAVRKLMLANNRLAALPAGFERMRELELLRLANNRFEALPTAALRCPRLKWLALGGNPCVERLLPPLKADALPDFDRLYKQLDDRLGAGTSGNVFRATRHADGARLAAKLFKARCGSDGAATDEVAVSLAARGVPHLVHAEAAARRGEQLVLLSRLVPGCPQPIAGPPSFASCTRSVYPADAAYSAEVAQRIIAAVREAVSGLLAKGIAHGDIYGHNLLLGEDEDGTHVALGDLGAAWPFPPEVRELVHAIEGRALQVLVDEVKTRIVDDAARTQGAS